MQFYQESKISHILVVITTIFGSLQEKSGVIKELYCKETLNTIAEKMLNFSVYIVYIRLI